MRRLLLPLSLALVAILPGAASAAVVKNTWETTVKVGPAKTPCNVVGNVWRDSAASAANPAPMVLATNGFGGSRDDYTAMGQAYAARGCPRRVPYQSANPPAA